LNDAFSFRRSINVDADSEAFSVAAGSAQENMAAAAAATTTTTTVAAAASSTETAGASATPRKIRRRVKKREVVVDDATVPVSNIPDLEMPAAAASSTVTTLDYSGSSKKYTAQELAEIDADFDKYVMGGGEASSSGTQWDKMQDWFPDDSDLTKAKHNGDQGTTTAPRLGDSAAESVAAQSRFQQQLSGNWNDQILSASDKLEPMAAVMNKIALLEQEKQAALRRLQDEFAQRTELEERYYREQRKLLEETATEIQSVAFGLDSKSSSSNTV
jgi:hypothetical protein